ncbi:penicillin-binding protein activator LpoB [Helicobacter saguini]|uniref:Penicillin-binding protein activator LpoB n=1 Tax=Helicobacter saguini TaxID=1548018 RepID=A0A347VSN1_9HELI|nr:penicillin-binding protein activator LpoB [Helicobacter saguini]MWV62431.1 penicillin-binding protein activator LpoB [Helicobacter saguini]MWV66897.1 penicillin-binding protein activator LpoB [Helicobacter saguini]MWV69245.1 penicillin-binding protein activator LpoB [Helicobacter saguini]MWV71199.1 penicillin-binding protein activator LpoB [Helicobacter saguini]TLD93321.1 penicillin-binding protein activator LpoB [Helicobacter saguini]
MFKYVGSGILSVVLSVGFVACGGKVEYVDNAQSSEFTSTGIDYHDIESAVAKSVQSLLNSEYVLDLDSKKVVAISDVINDTMQQVDVQDLTMKITRAMRKSGKFELTSAISGSGGMTDNMINKARNLRENDEFNQYTTQEKGTLVAPSLSLQGKIVQKNTRVKNKQRVDYNFLLVLTDLKTGVVKWDESTHIIKVAPNSKVSW